MDCLSRESQEIINFLERNKFHIPAIKPNPEFSKAVFSIYTEYTKTKLVCIPSENSSLIKFAKQFISTEIKNDIKSFKFNESINCGDNLHISVDSSEQINQELINKIKKRCIFMQQHYNHGQPINVDIYLTDNKKKLPSKGTSITADNVNSGYTNFTNIVLYRKEEILKVLVHELAHAVNIDGDFSVRFGKEFDSQFCFDSIQQRTKTTLPSETLTELIAGVFNIIFVIAESKGSLSRTDFLYKFYKLLEYEVTFSLFQTAKILVHFGFDNYSQFFNNKKCDKKVLQKTHVVSYYIIRSIILYNTQALMEFFVTQDKFMTFKLDYSETFKELLKKPLNDPTKIINKFMEQVKEIKTKPETSEFMETLRMTCIE
jgi:hypothetical protein